MINKNKYFNFLQIILGFILIIYILYNRTFRIRLPQDLDIYHNDNLNLNLVFLIIVSIFANIIVIYLSVKSLRSINNTEAWYKKIGLFISQFISDCLYEAYDYLISKYANAYDKVSFFCNKFYKAFGEKGEYLFIFLEYFIKFSILLVFLIDVFVYFRLFYFYTSLFLLLVVLFIKLLFFILRDYAKNLEEIKQTLIIIPEGLEKTTELPWTTYKPSKGNEHINLDYNVKEFISCNKITGYLDIYNKYTNYFIPRFLIIIHGLYLIGWFYILYKNFYL